MKLRQINKGYKCPCCKQYGLEWYHYETIGEGISQIAKGKISTGIEYNQFLRCRLCLAEFIEEK